MITMQKLTNLFKQILELQRSRNELLMDNKKLAQQVDDQVNRLRKAREAGL